MGTDNTINRPFPYDVLRVRDASSIIRVNPCASVAKVGFVFLNKFMTQDIRPAAEKRGQAHFPRKRLDDSRDVRSLKNRQTPFFSSLLG